MSATGRSAGQRRLALDALTTPRSSVLPFLPTLVTALVIGSLSLVCREPSTPEPGPVALPAIVEAELSRSGQDGLRSGVDTYDTQASVPATLAFARLYPIVPEAPSERVATNAGKPAPARIARSAKRPCIGSKCGENHRAEALRYASDAPRPVDATSSVPGKDSPFRIDPRPPIELPDGALPFSPTAEAMVDTVRAMGDGTASLGGAVLASLGEFY